MISGARYSGVPHSVYVRLEGVANMHYTTRKIGTSIIYIARQLMIDWSGNSKLY